MGFKCKGMVSSTIDPTLSLLRFHPRFNSTGVRSTHLRNVESAQPLSFLGQSLCASIAHWCYFHWLIGAIYMARTRDILLLEAVLGEGCSGRPDQKRSRVAKTLLTLSSGFVTTPRRVLHRPAKGINFNLLAAPQATCFKGFPMKTLKATLLLLTLSLPLWAVNHPDKDKKHDNDPPPVAVPEGGGTVTYLLASGAAAIVVVLVVRKRRVSRSVQ